ncbi:TraB/GumN family protein [Natronospora cellulosivora (SeqCode)]
MLKKKGIIFLCLIIFINLFTSMVLAESNFLWQIEDIDSNIYIMGSIHALPEGHYPLSDTVENAFAESDYLAVEVNVLELNEDEILQIVMEHGYYQAGETLADNIDEDLVSLIEERLQGFGIPEEMIFQFMQSKPWYLNIILADLEISTANFHFDHGVDMYFLLKALEQDKEILELETMESQLLAMVNMSPELQEEALRVELESTVSVEELLDDLLTAWLEADTAQMSDLIFEDLYQNPELEEYYTIMFDDRDLLMTDKIEEYIDEGKDVFVVVGAGHLVNKNGILLLLEERGYSLRQM